MGIEVRHINKKYNEVLILQDINLSVATGELVALLGPSGSGKTSLLRIIAGLEQADSGQVFLDNEAIETKKIQQRGVGFVFQQYALFQHLTVFDNVAFGLRVKSRNERPPTSCIHHKVNELLQLMHLEGLEKHYPYQISGGQQQRVALARALAVDPKVLLLDEPFGALDAKVRKELCRWIRMLHDEIKVSSIFVTHDQEEALQVADKVCIMDQGKIQQVDAPGKIWQSPANAFVFSFLGDTNEFVGWLDQDGVTNLVAPTKPDLLSLKLYARPWEISLSKVADKTKYFKATITHLNLTGSLVKIELQNNRQQRFLVEMTHAEYDSLGLNAGESVFIIPKKLHRFK